MYLDTCILVKLLSHEPDSAAWHQVVLGHPVFTSELAVAETRSALLSKERAGRISRQARMLGWRLFQDKIREQEFILLPLNRQVIERAGGIIDQCHPKVALRTLDAVHVATMELHGGEEMASCDQRVCDACNLLGLPQVPLPVAG
jgi:predicted nucleic acid-binding protein